MSTFDTLHAAKTLTQAGFAPPQAEAITDTIRAAFSDSVATKADIAALKADMTELRSELKGDLAELRSELKGDIATTKADIEFRLDGRNIGFAPSADSAHGETGAVSGLGAWRDRRRQRTRRMASRARSSATRLRPTIGVVGANPASALSDSLSPPQKPSSRFLRA